jgi:hypothetical protein
MPRTTKGRRRLRGTVLRRWIAVGALLLVGLLYYRPLHAYLDARSQRAVRLAAVRRLESEQASLQKRLKESSSLAVLEQEARALGYVRKGEHLFIVKNVAEWRAHRHAGTTPRRGR